MKQDSLDSSRSNSNPHFDLGTIRQHQLSEINTEQNSTISFGMVPNLSNSGIANSSIQNSGLFQLDHMIDKIADQDSNIDIENDKIQLSKNSQIQINYSQIKFQDFTKNLPNEEKRQFLNLDLTENQKKVSIIQSITHQSNLEQNPACRFQNSKANQKTGSQNNSTQVQQYESVLSDIDQESKNYSIQNNPKIDKQPSWFTCKIITKFKYKSGSYLKISNGAIISPEAILTTLSSIVMTKYERKQQKQTFLQGESKVFNCYQALLENIWVEITTNTSDGPTKHLVNLKHKLTKPGWSLWTDNPFSQLVILVIDKIDHIKVENRVQLYQNLTEEDINNNKKNIKFIECLPVQPNSFSHQIKDENGLQKSFSYNNQEIIMGVGLIIIEQTKNDIKSFKLVGFNPPEKLNRLTYKPIYIFKKETKEQRDQDPIEIYLSRQVPLFYKPQSYYQLNNQFSTVSIPRGTVSLFNEAVSFLDQKDTEGEATINFYKAIEPIFQMLKNNQNSNQIIHQTMLSLADLWVSIIKWQEAFYILSTGMYQVSERSKQHIRKSTELYNNVAKFYANDKQFQSKAKTILDHLNNYQKYSFDLNFSLAKIYEMLGIFMEMNNFVQQALNDYYSISQKIYTNYLIIKSDKTTKEYARFLERVGDIYKSRNKQMALVYYSNSMDRIKKSQIPMREIILYRLKKKQQTFISI